MRLTPQRIDKGADYTIDRFFIDNDFFAIYLKMNSEPTQSLHQHTQKYSLHRQGCPSHFHAVRHESMRM